MFTLSGKYNPASSLFASLSLLFNIGVHHVGFCKYDSYESSVLLEICSVLYSIPELPLNE